MLLEDAMECIIDYRGKTPKKQSFGVPLITAKIIKDGRILNPTEFLAEDYYDQWMTRGIPKTGDVVLTVEAPLGQVAQIPDYKVGLAQRVITLRGKKDILDNTFLKYFLMSPRMQSTLRGHETGTTVTGIKQSTLRKIDIHFPNFSIQKAIARILGTLDDKIELNKKMNQTLEEIAKSIFKSWFVDFDPVRAKAEGRPTGLPSEISDLFPDELVDSEIGETPRGWEVKTISDLAECVGGATPSTKNPDFWEGGNLAWTSPKDLSTAKSIHLLKTDKKITEAGLRKISSGLLPIGTVLLSSRAPVGYLALTTEPTAINQGYIALKPKSKISNYFLLNWCESHLNEIKNRASGTTFAEISKAAFRPIPAIAPSSEVMEKFHELTSPIYERALLASRETETLGKLRDTLLPKLISGELRVSDAEKFLEEAGI